MLRDEQSRRRELIEYYISAKQWVLTSSFANEVEWQISQDSGQARESEFLREYAWVVLNSGFRERVIRGIFGYISLCFCDWESAAEITAAGRVCVEAARKAFRNERKLDAILQTANFVHHEGFEGFWRRIERSPEEQMRKLPFMGEITAAHLAKNMGFAVAKPDRHLVRVACRYGFSDVTSMCSVIASEIGDRVSMADIILWRYEEQRRLNRELLAL